LAVVSSVLQFIGILLSIFRFWFRFRIRRLWWEDAWAFIAFLCAVALLISEWLYLQAEWNVSVVGFWIYAFAFTCMVWAVRLSILFSVTRIIHPTQPLRRLMHALSALFLLLFIGLTAQKLWWFTEDLSWLHETAYYNEVARYMTRPMLILELCTDIIADGILIILPVRILWSVKLPKRQRRMIIAIFSSSVIVTIVSAFRATCQMMGLASFDGIATDVEVAFSSITCNMLVVATVMYRFIRD
ncbi:hypothetical protein HYDPIDRAFT_73628, partial [Hydnomerulius pinastri MD-312]